MQGHQRGDLAGELFLSPKTVERHLSSVYRKRGLRSRTELAVDFHTQGGPAPADRGD